MERGLKIEIDQIFFSFKAKFNWSSFQQVPKIFSLKTILVLSKVDFGNPKFNSFRIGLPMF